MNRYIKEHSAGCAVAVVLTILEVVIGAVQPKLIAQIIDIGIQNSDMDYILHVGITMLILCVLGYVTGFTATIVSGKIAAQIGHKLRTELFEKTMMAETQEVDSMNKSSLFLRISGDCHTIMDFLAELIHTAVKPVALFLSGLVMVFVINPIFGVVVLVSTAIEILLMFFLYKQTSDRFAKIRVKLDGLIKVLRQNIIGARLVKIFSNQKKEQTRFEGQNEIVKEESYNVWRFCAKMNGWIMLVMNTVILLVLLLCAMQASQQPSRAGEVLAVITYSQQITMSVMSFGLLFRYLADVKVAVQRVGEVLKLKQESLHTQIQFEEQIQEITFKNVSFSYDNHYCLKNISFTLKAGETVGILGETATGKSLLIHLLSGVYPVTSGEILINGKNMSMFSPASIRNHLTIVSQDDDLFSGTIEENIMWSREGDIQEASRLAEADSFVTGMKYKYKTKLYDKGRNLSGGQRQRIQLARAFCSCNEVLVLDDAISQIDVLAKRNIINNIKSMNENRIIIFTSQRASFLKECDKIIIMKDGEILQTGRHEELSEQCNYYRAFCSMQNGGVE